MSLKEEFVDAVKDSLDSRVEGMSFRPNVEIWPEDDDDALWVSSHRNRIRTLICDTPEFRDTPFCGSGLH